MILLALLALLVAELYVLVLVGQAVGVLLAILLLLATSTLGGYLVRWAGGSAQRKLAEAMQADREPSKEVANGLLIMFGGALLILPGFVTDAMGLLLIFPPTRALARGTLVGLVLKRMTGPMGPVVGLGGLGMRAHQHRTAHRDTDHVIDGEVVDERPAERDDREDPG